MILQKQVVQSGEIQPKGNTNHIWIYDRSQSMSWTLRQLVEDMIVHSKMLKEGDLLSVAWFSTEGMYDFPVRGMFINKESLGMVESLLHKNNRPIGLTCFSEVLSDCISSFEVMQQLNPDADNALVFFTDGHPVVSNPSHERNSVIRTLKQMPVDRALFVGYGDYYNKPFMAEMAEACNGMLVHASNLAMFNEAAETFVEGSGVSYIEYYLGVEPIEVFTIDKGLVMPLKVEGEKIKAAPGSTIYFTRQDKTPVEEKFGNPFEPDDTGFYALALFYLQRFKFTDVVDTLGKLGDVALIDMATNAFTNQDYGNLEAEIREVMVNPTRRFLAGKDINYLPKEDAPCILDVLEMLVADDFARFYPYHSGFNYKRIGRKTERLEGFPDIKLRDVDKGVPFNALVWNATRPNISIRAMFHGDVELNSGYTEDSGLPYRFDAVTYRNYTIVKDGNLHTMSIPITCSAGTLSTLQEIGVVDASADEVTVLNLDGLPVINRQIATKYMSDIDFYVDILERELDWSAYQKVISYYLDKYNPEGLKLDSDYTLEQQDVLKLNGISAKGVYSTPVEVAPVEDYYMAKELVVYKDKMKSFPAVKDVIAKMEAGKKLTPREELIGNYIPDMQAREANPMKFLPYLEEQKSMVKDELSALRRYIQRVLFAVIVGKQWFSELDGYDGAEYDSWIFSLNEKQVAF